MVRFLLPLNLAAVLLCPLLAQAQGTGNQVFNVQPSSIPTQFTLASALKFALANNPELASSRHEILANAGAVRQAGMWPNPEVSLVVEAARQNTRSTTWQLNQTLELGGKRAARVHVAELASAAARNELALKAAHIRADVTRHFYGTLLAQERSRLAQRALELAQRASAVAKRQLALGKIAPLEATRASIAEAAMRVELAQANSQEQSSKHSFALALGAQVATQMATQMATQVTSQVQLQGQFDTLPQLVDLAQLTQRLPQAPLLQRAKLELDKRLALSSLEKAQQTPDVSVSLGAKREQQTGRQQAIIGLSLPLPLFDRSALQETRSRAEMARADLLATEQRLSSELLQLHQSLAVARIEAELLQKEVLPDAHNAVELALKGFDYGKFSMLEVLDAQRTLLQAQTQYLRSLGQAQHAAAAIEATLGDSQWSLFSANLIVKE